jgi:hypothetical protein
MSAPIEFHLLMGGLFVFSLLFGIWMYNLDLPETNVDSSAKQTEVSATAEIATGGKVTACGSGPWASAKVKTVALSIDGQTYNINYLKDALKAAEAFPPGVEIGVHYSPVKTSGVLIPPSKDDVILASFKTNRSIRKTSQECHVHTSKVADTLKRKGMYHLVSFKVLTEQIRKDVLKSLLANKTVYDAIYDAFYHGDNTNEQVAQAMGVPGSTIDIVWDAMCEDPVPDREAFYARNGSSK